MLVGGLDEVGWGSIAGFLLSAVAVFRDEDLRRLPKQVTDSKKLSELARESLYEPILDIAVDVGLGHAWPWEIDDLGPHEALHLSYRRAIGALRVKPEFLIVDGTSGVAGWGGRQRSEPKADLNHRQVSAASIIAKVERDRGMEETARLYPVYRWEKNKGYGSQDHQEAINRHGLVLGAKTPTTYIHRRRYCQKALLRRAANA